MTSDLRSLTHAALRARQQKIERAVERVEAQADSSYGRSSSDLNAQHNRLLAEWEAIESEWTRRAALTGDEAMADLSDGWPSE